MPLLVKSIIITALGPFLVPIVAHAALNLFEERPQSWRNIDWSGRFGLEDLASAAARA
jgi:hypothetical protein